MLPNASGFGLASPSVFALGWAVLDCAFLGIGRGFLVGSDTETAPAAILDFDEEVGFTAAFLWILDAGRVARAATKPFVGRMLLTLNPSISSFRELGGDRADVSASRCADREADTAINRSCIFAVPSFDW